MLRPLPTVRASCWYHVTDRGAPGEPLLATPADRDRFVRALGRIAYEFLVELHAYCAMGTHVHVLARGERTELARAFSRLATECGLLSEGARIRGLPFGRHMLQVTRYIHRNPVGAGLVGRAADWPWSSFPAYVDPVDQPPWLRAAPVLGWFGSIGARQRYRWYVDGAA